MSGHSKWSQIKHRKAATDKKKGQLFSKISKLISLAAKKGIDPEKNFELKNAVDKARSINMPSDNIKRAINRVSDPKNQLEEIYINAIGPGNTALSIQAITDNKNRTIAEIKKILSDGGAKMVAPGSIDWMFKQKTKINNNEIVGQLDKLFENLDDHDDVEAVFSNLD